MSDSSDSPYPQVPNRPDFPAIEERVLALWDKNKSFEESVANRSSDNEYVFYDGPPFANGLPHHGHLLTGFVKDVVPRYQTMRGKKLNEDSAGIAMGSLLRWKPNKS